MGLIPAVFVAIIIMALVWWVLAKLIGPILAGSGTPFLTTLGTALVDGAILLAIVAGVFWFFFVNHTKF